MVSPRREDKGEQEAIPSLVSPPRPLESSRATSQHHWKWDFLWEPVPWESHQRHAWPSQHQQDAGIYLVPTNWDKIDTNYHSSPKIKTKGVATAIVEIDHLDGNAGKISNTVKRVRYFDNYRDTLIRLAKSIGREHEFVWVCSSVCDYTNFDFSWHPDQWQATMLHVFASDGEKFGDTFLMHVPTFAKKAECKALLEWYDVNFVETSVPRRPIPVIQHNYDSQVDAVKSLDWPGPLALFTTTGYVENLVTVPLWREQTKTIVPLSKGATSVVVPKTAIPYIKKQLYDYPHINRTQHMLKDQPLDIVFISNGEPNATHNFNFMQVQCNVGAPRVKRIDGVNGRVAAYHAAAEASNTPWFFAVFAKLEINPGFNFDWQPDRMQQPKHYIFHALNPVNELEYGHQAMIAYNRKLVLENPGTGLDFTLDSEHEVVPLLSGIAYYNHSAWITWRTAFREALKLRSSLPDVENEYRLNVWLTKDNTPDQWSLKGAHDAVEYYEEVRGDFKALRKSYEWDWLATYAFVKHSLVVS